MKQRVRFTKEEDEIIVKHCLKNINNFKQACNIACKEINTKELGSRTEMQCYYRWMYYRDTPEFKDKYGNVAFTMISKHSVVTNRKISSNPVVKKVNKSLWSKLLDLFKFNG